MGRRKMRTGADLKCEKMSRRVGEMTKWGLVPASEITIRREKEKDRNLPQI